MWCDYCGRVKQKLPAKTSVTDIGGELICSDCNMKSITTGGVYWVNEYERLILVCYRGKQAKKSVLYNGRNVHIDDRINFDDGENVKRVYEEIQKVKGPAKIIIDANHTDEE